MPEQTHPLVQLAGSERAPLASATPAGQLDTSERAELTLVLRRRAAIPAGIVEGPTVLTSDQLAEQYGADPADVDLVRFGLIQTRLYAGVTPGDAVPGFRDIISGDNGAYAAGPGWDACSGLGSPDGTALLNRLQG